MINFRCIRDSTARTGNKNTNINNLMALIVRWVEMFVGKKTYLLIALLLIVIFLIVSGCYTRNLPTCNGVDYNPEIALCCEGTILNNVSEYKMGCCNGTLFHYGTESCCAGEIIDITGEWRCCGGIMKYRPSENIIRCYAGNT
jgi:hypothetical protein